MSGTTDAELAFNTISNLTAGDRIENESDDLIFYNVDTAFNIKT